MPFIGIRKSEQKLSKSGRRKQETANGTFFEKVLPPLADISPGQFAGNLPAVRPHRRTLFDRIDRNDQKTIAD